MKTAPLALLFAFTAAGIIAPTRAQTTTSAAAPSADGISQTGSGTARYRVSEATIAWSATPATEPALREALGKFGLREKQVSTSSIGQETVYVWFAVTDLRRLSEILAACERVGGSIGAVTFRGRDDDAERARRAAMRAAVDDARKSAEVWADAAGVRLGKALAISGQSTSASPEGGVPIGPDLSILRSVKDLKVPESMIASAAVTVRFALQ